jgi:hypothetical protein
MSGISMTNQTSLVFQLALPMHKLLTLNSSSFKKKRGKRKRKSFNTCAMVNKLKEVVICQKFLLTYQKNRKMKLKLLASSGKESMKNVNMSKNVKLSLP